MTLTKSNPNAIELNNVSVDVPAANILRDISWTIPRGCHAAVLGPNGCGKSTLLKSITAYGHVTRGRITVLGETIGATQVHALRQRMGILDPTLIRLIDPKMTTEDLVVTGFLGNLTIDYEQPTSTQRQAARQILQEVDLEQHVGQKFVTLSAGQKSRAWLARALVHEPELLVLDEPTADLDIVGREKLLATLNRLAKARPDMTVLMVTHHLEDLMPSVGQILLLSRGNEVTSGPPESVFVGDHVSTAFGIPITVDQFQGRWRWSVSPDVWQQL